MKTDLLSSAGLSAAALLSGDDEPAAGGGRAEGQDLYEGSLLHCKN